MVLNRMSGERERERERVKGNRLTNTIQYSARFVGRRYTNRPGAPYNSNKKVSMNDQTEQF